MQITYWVEPRKDGKWLANVEATTWFGRLFNRPAKGRWHWPCNSEEEALKAAEAKKNEWQRRLW
jgi:hypothetical protein